MRVRSWLPAFSQFLLKHLNIEDILGSRGLDLAFHRDQMFDAGDPHRVACAVLENAVRLKVCKGSGSSRNTVELAVP